MKKAKLAIATTFLSLSIITGAVIGFISDKAPYEHGHANTGIGAWASLEDQFYNVDLIIRGIKAATRKMLKASEDVLLILSRTTDGTYWSYNFDDGIWRIEDNKVTSNSTSELLQAQASADRTGHNLEEFIKIITTAAENKKTPISIDE